MSTATRPIRTAQTMLGIDPPSRGAANSCKHLRSNIPLTRTRRFATVLVVRSPLAQGGNEMNEKRFQVQDVSVGSAGVAARPAVVDTTTGNVVHTYRRNERHLAEAMAAKLNDSTEAL